MRLVLTDRKLTTDLVFDAATSTLDYTLGSDVQSYTNYYPFGMEMETGEPEENALAEKYRYGFNGKENDREWGTAGLTQDYGFRLYNPALGKFLSVDPLADSYSWYTPYQFAGNRPINSIDLDGLEAIKVTVTGDFDTGGAYGATGSLGMGLAYDGKQWALFGAASVGVSFLSSPDISGHAEFGWNDKAKDISGVIGGSAIKFDTFGFSWDTGGVISIGATGNAISYSVDSQPWITGATLDELLENIGQKVGIENVQAIDLIKQFGEELKIRYNLYSNTKAGVYEMRYGDTMQGIAAVFGWDNYMSLAAYNEIRAEGPGNYGDWGTVKGFDGTPNGARGFALKVQKPYRYWKGNIWSPGYYEPYTDTKEELRLLDNWYWNISDAPQLDIFDINHQTPRLARKAAQSALQEMKRILDSQSNKNGG